MLHECHQISKATLLIQVNLHLLNYITVHERITVLARGDMLLVLTVKKKDDYLSFLYFQAELIFCYYAKKKPQQHGEMCIYMYYMYILL